MTKLLICIPVHNRRAIAEACIPTVVAGMDPHDAIAIFDDGSDGFDSGWIRGLLPFWRWNGAIFHHSLGIGIEAQRRKHFECFRDMVHLGFTHLYLTDADALHDPNWRADLLRLQTKYDGLPICGYDTEAHRKINGNTVEDHGASEIIVRRVAPGISYLLTAAQAGVVIRALPSLPAHWHWDWTVPALLGSRFAVTRQSVVDHLGEGGLHHPAGAGLDGGDIALNPTHWLVKKRAEVVAALKAQMQTAISTP